MTCIKIKLKKLKHEHIEMVRVWRNSPEVSKHMYTSSHISKLDQERWYNKIKSDNSKQYWIIQYENTFIGVLNLYDINMENKNAFWAYYIADPNVRGKGIGKTLELNILEYVFNRMKLNKLSCEVLSFNEIVVIIHQKYGSKIEGTFREHILKNDKYVDVIRMSILKNEWLNEVKDSFEIPECEIDYY